MGRWDYVTGPYGHGFFVLLVEVFQFIGNEEVAIEPGDGVSSELSSVAINQDFLTLAGRSAVCGGRSSHTCLPSVKTAVFTG